MSGADGKSTGAHMAEEAAAGRFMVACGTKTAGQHTQTYIFMIMVTFSISRRMTGHGFGGNLLSCISCVTGTILNVLCVLPFVVATLIRAADVSGER